MAETLNSTHPKFAVVGHPNKGKSSIVSALAMDDSVQISDTPGTTVRQRSFPLNVDGKVLYELFDTPGFQRARRVLAWLEKHDVSADRKHEVVRAFLKDHKDDERYSDEIALLEPIMEGAGIIYVVDASKPYGKEYEAEMEVLRWTGQPSMALINHIETSDYTIEWKRALEQYFKMVRTFNPMQMSITQHVSILESMAQLKEEWVTPVKASIKLFEMYHQQMVEKSAFLISRLIYESTSRVEKLLFYTEDASEEDNKKIEKKYKDTLRKLEIDVQDNIEHIWNHDNLQLKQEGLTFEGMDLFSEETASVFGLTRKELIITGATSGAVAGAGIDLLFVGHTLLLGGLIGGVAGGVGAYFGFDELSEVKVLGQTLGKRYLQMGPMKNRNFPYILLGRALYHTQKVSKRSHAKRGVADLEMGSAFKDTWLDENLRKSLETYHKKFRKTKAVEAEVLQEYEDLIKKVLEGLN
ncbi:MAG: GTP-binding protein [uncultured Sulfurovum sp.]|uniref:GTP-binding protein n=1 Tax=uncultured Sulfurovum sp. TaxID=269237 RepID=A0A6S6SJ68_9BACT|nr:MAG: GTP-binding protein [uncultured Sulfurovum sp.]